ncbi:SDR family oxidoreductase [Streptomyces sp. NBC_00523]|uniref:SDR family oxidoreductase n=1 Tax=Streptomyces sp. NBC_00523 TaxID=2975765 RepID=UPI002E81192C|nr:SDR family oxidoreductase [Streptomyces sp. NBC_00523]WUD04109.1 SDR family oxidoreductase [Streptomyces sp. NBC_00523]
MTGIDGKVVAITGAGSGIGEASALLLASRGAKLVLGGRRSNRLEALGARIEANGGTAVWKTTDVRHRGDLADLVAYACERYGALDVLVSNAGIGPISPFDELRVEDWDQMIDVNFRGVLHGIAAALPVFRKQGTGQFVNVVSTAGLRIVPNQAVYAATKNAVRTVSEGLRQEAGPDLRVTMISPGYVATEFLDSVTSPTVKSQTPAVDPSLSLSPGDIARAVAFAIEQPSNVDIGDIVVRPTAQS